MQSMEQLLVLTVVTCVLSHQLVFAEINEQFYSIAVEDVYGDKVTLGTFRNQVLLVVNVASECGYTDHHYRELVDLREQLGPTGYFQVLAFPCNQFGGQEPKGIHDIQHFVSAKYKINFLLFNKVDVVGSNASTLWKYLQDVTHRTPTWNFWKYLIDHEGHVLGGWGPQTRVSDLIPLITDTVETVARANERREL